MRRTCLGVLAMIALGFLTAANLPDSEVAQWVQDHNGQAQTDAVLPRHLAAEVRGAGEDLLAPHVSRTLSEVERAHIDRTLRAHGANRTRAARELGISRATLIKKIREYELGERPSAVGRAGRAMHD